MALLNTIINQYGTKRLKEIDFFKKNPIEVQENMFKKLIKNSYQTEFGRKYDIQSIKSINKFAENIPINEYEDLLPYINRILNGEQNILISEPVNWFAKSSGTTSTRSKYIPITKLSLQKCHFQSGKDIYFIYNNFYPDTKIFNGKTLSIGGSTSYTKDNNSYSGDLSAIILKNLPWWSGNNMALSKGISLIPEWDRKLNEIIQTTYNKNIVQIVGVPSWLMVLFRKLLDFTGKKNILEIWKNLELFVHGGVNFEPYQEIYKKYIPSISMNYFETYNASEGFFGLQDEFYRNKKDLLLMLDYEIFYEFINLSDYNSGNLKAIPLSEISLDKNYVMVITTNGGLWRYIIGDTIKFTSKNPYRFILTGRTKHFINLFGEELMVHNADSAVFYACQQTNSLIKEYTAAPIMFENKESQGRHEWIFEFIQKPDDMNLFMNYLDKKLQEINSDYEAKRYKGINLAFPSYTTVKEGIFEKVLENKNKLGGQNKVPRLSNDRKFLKEILTIND
ncbi:MAG: GH3 auxin-responsive promoter family protein [Bacteroidales bacterium]|jgi:hypothetical protein|nr:GH3 auxin-responsive promoter family protein [Bacteroidales bacterium]